MSQSKTSIYGELLIMPETRSFLERLPPLDLPPFPSPCGRANFLVVFYDSEREINIGSVRIEASQDFKNFQSSLSQKIEISANQITIYLVERKKPKSSTEVRWKIPVTGKKNFVAVVKETDCVFLVVLKHMRRNRRSKPKQKQDGGCSGVEFVDHLSENVASSLVKPTGAEQSKALQSDCVAGVLELQREVDEFPDSERELRDVDELECDFDSEFGFGFGFGFRFRFVFGREIWGFDRDSTVLRGVCECEKEWNYGAVSLLRTGPGRYRVPIDGGSDCSAA